MKDIKTKIKALGNKVKSLPKKYLIIGSVLLLLGLIGIGMLIWQLTDNGDQKTANTSNRKTTQTSESQADAGDNMSETDNPTVTNPDDPTTSDNGTTANGATGSSNGSKTKKSSGGGTGAPAPAPQPDTTKPTTPSGFTVVNGPGVSRIMDWDPSSDNVGVVGYHIYKMYFSNETPTRIIDTIDDGSTDDTEGDEPGLFCNHSGSTTYYAVRAFDAAGNLSDPIIASIPDEEWVNCTPIGV